MKPSAYFASNRLFCFPFNPVCAHAHAWVGTESGAWQEVALTELDIIRFSWWSETAPATIGSSTVFTSPCSRPQDTLSYPVRQVSNYQYKSEVFNVSLK